MSVAHVLLRNPRRELEVDAPKRVKALLRDLGIDPETVLVIRGADLLTREDLIEAEDQIEVRPVISGGDRGVATQSAAAALRTHRR
jgi:sulfur carrier protein